MTDQLTAAGLELDDYETVRALVVAELRAQISTILDVSPDQPVGQLVDIILEKRQALSELLQELHTSRDPDQASGATLDGICSLTGTYRDPATSGTVTLSLDLDAATTVPAGSIAAVSGDADNQWVLDADVTSVGAGVYQGTATAANTGPIQALAGTITVIVTAVAGWNSVTNALDAVVGQDVETDASLRTKREIELFQGGSTTLGAIVSEVAAIDEIISVVGYENTAWYTVDGMPPHSVEICYYADVITPTPATLLDDLAEAIYTTKATGIRAYGSDTDGSGTLTRDYVDSYGTHPIGFTRATEILVDLEYTLTKNDDYGTDAAFKDYVAAWAAANLSIGDNVLYTKFIDVGYNVDGIDNLSLRLRLHLGAWGTTDISIYNRQIGIIEIGNITVI